MAQGYWVVVMSNSILSIEGVTKSFGGLDVLKGVSLEIEAGSITGIIGPNGAGKSTLFDIITGYQTSDNGSILFDGENIVGLPPHLFARRGLIRTFQLTRVFTHLTVSENLLVFADAKSYGGSAGTKEKALDLLEFVHLIGLANDEASTLSYGQLKLLELAQVLMHSPKLLLLDEPFAGINPGLIDKIVQHLGDLNKAGMTIVLIEHNLPMVASLCDSIAVVSNGVIEIVGTPDEVVNNPRVKEVFLGG